MGLSAKLFSIYSKLLFSFLIVMIPICVLSLKMNEYGEQNVRKEIKDSIQSRVSFYSLLLETEFSRIISMQEEYVNDRELRKLSIADPFISDIERYDTIVSVQGKLARMVNTSPYILNAAVHLPSVQRSISGTALFGTLPEEEYEALKAIKNRYENPFVAYRNRLFISFPYSNVALLNGQEPLFLIGVELNQQHIKRMLDSFTIGGSGGSMMIGPDGDWTVAGGSGSILWSELKPLLGDVPGGGSAVMKEAVVNGGKYWLTAQRFPSLGVTLLSYVPESDIVGSLSQYRTWYWALLGGSALLIALFAYWIFLQIHQPMRRLMRAFQRVESGNWVTVLSHKRQDEFGYLYIQFNSMVAKMNELIHEVYEQKFRANLSELRQLQSQINPHFLYNSFYNLYRMARNEENDNIAVFSKHLGSYFYFITRTQQDEVPLVEEAGFARNYVDIQTFRFIDRIAVTFGDVPESIRAFKVPKLTIQPLIENAYQHGLRNTIEGGRLEVRFEPAGDGVVIIVEDNGEGMTESQYGELLRKLKSTSLDVETTGVVNVHRRIQLKHGPDSGISVVNEPGAFQVRLYIP